MCSLEDTRRKVKEAMADDFDTRTAIRLINELISKASDEISNKDSIPVSFSA